MPEYTKPTYDLSSTRTVRPKSVRDTRHLTEQGPPDATPLSWRERWIVDNAELTERLFSTPSAGDTFSLRAKENTLKSIQRLEKSRGQGSVNWSQSLPDNYVTEMGIPEPPPYREWKNHFPFNVREARKFDKECRRRFSDPNCPTVECYGRQRPFICLYGMPCAPKETVYVTDPFDRMGCIGFATPEAAQNLKTLVQSPANTPPNYYAHYEAEKTSNGEARYGGHNCAYSIDGSMAHNALPGTGFWHDPKTQTRFQPHKKNKHGTFDAKTARRPMAIRKMLVNMASKTGLYIRAPFPADPAKFEKPRSAEEQNQAFKRHFPYFPQAIMETYTALVAAALGIHPPIYAMILVGFGFNEDDELKAAYYKRGYEFVQQLLPMMVMERGLAAFDSRFRQQAGSTQQSQVSFTTGVPYPLASDPCYIYMQTDQPGGLNYYRSVVNTFLARRLSDRIAEAANEFLIHADIKPDNILLKRRYGRIESNLALSDTEFDIGSHKISIWWLPSDIYLIDFHPSFASFLPRPVSSYPRHDSEQEEAWRYYLEYKTRAGVRTAATTLFETLGKDYEDFQSVVSPECLRLIMLFLIILNAFTQHREFAFRDRAELNRLKAEFMQIYGQIYRDIMNILSGKGAVDFGALCTSLFTGDLRESLFSKPDTNATDPLFKNLLNGFKLVTQINDHKETQKMWALIAKQILRMFHHYVFDPSIKGADKLRVEKKAPPVVFKGVHMVNRQRQQLLTKGEVIVSIAIVMRYKEYLEAGVEAAIKNRVEYFITRYEMPGVDRHTDEVKAPNVTISSNLEAGSVVRLTMRIITATLLEAKAMKEFLELIIPQGEFLPPYVGSFRIQIATDARGREQYKVDIQPRNMPPSFAASQPGGAWAHIIQERLANQVIMDDADRGRYDRNFLMVLVGMLGMGIEYFYDGDKERAGPSWDYPYLPERKAGDQPAQMVVEDDKPAAVVNPDRTSPFGPLPALDKSLTPYVVPTPPSPEAYNPPSPSPPKADAGGSPEYNPFEEKVVPPGPQVVTPEYRPAA